MIGEPTVTITLPPLYCPGAAGVHPEAAALAARGMDFMARHGFCETEADRIGTANIDAGNFVAHWFPDVYLDTARLQVVTDLLYLEFRLDDLRYEHLGPGDAAISIALMTQHLRVFEFPQAFPVESLEQFNRAAQEISHRVYTQSSPTQAVRLKRGLYRFFVGLLAESVALHSEVPPTLEEYMPIRMATVGALFMIDVMGFVCQETVPGREWDTRKVEAAGCAGMFVAMCDNEMFSRGKEQWLASRRELGNRRPANIIALIQERTDCSSAEAVDLVADYRNRAMCVYLHLRDELLRSRPSPALSLYFRVVDDVIRGNLEYHRTGERYHNPGGLSPHAIEFRSIDIVDRCVARDHRPINSAMSWIWDELEGSLGCCQ